MRNYTRSLTLLMRAKKEIATKAEWKLKSEKITSIIQAGVDTQAIASRAKSNKMMPVQCSMCFADCRSKRAFGRHVIEFHPDATFHCQYCTKFYKMPNGLYKHEKTHTDPKSICAICGRIFKSVSELKSHLPVHDDAQKVPCEDCGKLFSSKRTQKRHAEVHQNLHIACASPECVKTFATKD